MKYLVVLALCATAAFAEIVLDNKSMEKFAVECAREHHISLESTAEIENSCFSECFGKKLGVIKEDGTYDIEAILVNATTPQAKEEGRKTIDMILKTCNMQVGNERCKMAFCMFAMLGV